MFSVIGKPSDWMFFGAQAFEQYERAYMKLCMDMYADCGRYFRQMTRLSWELWLEQHEVIEFVPVPRPPRLVGPHEVVLFPGLVTCTG